MKLVALVLFCLSLLCAPRPRAAEDGSLGNELRTQIELIEKSLIGLKRQLSSTSAAVNKLDRQAAGNEADQARIARIDDLEADARKAELGALQFAADLAEIKKVAAANSTNIEEIKSQIAKLGTQSEKLRELNKDAQRLSKELEDFKAYTNMVKIPVKRGIGAGLEAKDDGRTIPLAGKRVIVSLQHKEGPPQKLEDVITDQDGVAQVARPDVRDRPSPMYVVFEFAGDEENRPSRTRIKIR